CNGGPVNATNCLPIYPNLLVPIGATSTNVLVAPAVQYFASNFQLPQIHQADLVFERQIARNTAVSASYLFSFANSLPNFVDTNLPQPSQLVTFTAVGGPFDGRQWQFPLFTG